MLLILFVLRCVYVEREKRLVDLKSRTFRCRHGMQGSKYPTIKNRETRMALRECQWGALIARLISHIVKKQNLYHYKRPLKYFTVVFVKRRDGWHLP